MKNNLLSKRIFFSPTRRCVACSFSALVLLLTIAFWLFPFNPASVSAIDKTPVPDDDTDETSSPLERIEEPVFAEVTPEPETETCPPLYEVPWALNPHDHFYFTRPIAVDSNTDPLPDFRYGYYYQNEDTVHTGVDIPSPLHKPVLAAGDGQVVFTGYGLMNGAGHTDDPYGLAVLIRHDFSYNNKTIYTVYAHLDRIDVETGQTVNMGDQIGTIGMTGNTSGPHVHFEVRVDDSEGNRIQNPELWLSPPIGSGVLAGRIKNDFGYFISTQEIKLKSLETEATYDIFTYAPVKHIFADDYYHENFAIGSLPAGGYEISMLYKNKWYRSKITISPGAVNFIFFNGKNGFSQQYPAAPQPEDFMQ